MEKKKEITIILIDLFDKLGVDTPHNFDIILEFVYKNINETADKENWNDSDVAKSFIKWIDSI